MPYTAKSIANAFIALAARQGVSVSNMKLQKLLYFAHAMYLATQGRALIAETPEAWQYGPVYPSVYHQFKHFGAGQITGFATDWDVVVPPPQEADVQAFLESIWRTYGHQTAIALSALSHVQDGPWAQARLEHPGSTGPRIPDERIRDYYATALRQVSQQRAFG